MATAAAAAAVSAKPASKEELELFIGQNKRWLIDDAESVLRAMAPVDQKRVISAGTMSSVRDPSAVIQARVRKARETEAQLLRGQNGLPVIASGAVSELSCAKPASKEELDTFIKANERWLQGEACDILRAMNAVDQKRVIAGGTLSGCRDPVAVIQTRAKKAREMELELANLEAARAAPAAANAPVIPAMTFNQADVAMHLYAPPALVTSQESKFAPPPAFYRDDLKQVTVGEERGVGGVVEILKAKYGLGKGMRLKVIGETAALLQFEGGKTVPKEQEDKGWRWCVRAEEEKSKRLAAELEASKAQQQEAAAAAEKAAAAEGDVAKDAEAVAAKEASLPIHEESPRRKRSRSSSSSSTKEVKKKEASAKEKDGGRNGSKAGSTSKQKKARSSSSSSTKPPPKKADKKKAAEEKSKARRKKDASSSGSRARSKSVEKSPAKKKRKASSSASLDSDAKERERRRKRAAEKESQKKDKVVEDKKKGKDRSDDDAKEKGAKKKTDEREKKTKEKESKEKAAKEKGEGKDKGAKDKAKKKKARSSSSSASRSASKAREKRRK